MLANKHNSSKVHYMLLSKTNPTQNTHGRTFLSSLNCIFMGKVCPVWSIAPICPHQLFTSVSPQCYFDGNRGHGKHKLFHCVLLLIGECPYHSRMRSIWSVCWSPPSGTLNTGHVIPHRHRHTTVLPLQNSKHQGQFTHCCYTTHAVMRKGHTLSPSRWRRNSLEVGPLATACTEHPIYTNTNAKKGYDPTTTKTKDYLSPRRSNMHWTMRLPYWQLPVVLTDKVGWSS